MAVENFRELFETGLRYAYDCEQKLVKKGIPTMVEAASSQDLRSALEQHLEETRIHVTRLEQVFSKIGADAETEDNDVVDELMSAAKDMADDIDESALRDAALIVSGNQVEHYEMAVYGSLVAFARQLGLNDVVQLLEQILKEEKNADAKLSQIGESSINPRAAQERKAA